MQPLHHRMQHIFQGIGRAVRIFFAYPKHTTLDWLYKAVDKKITSYTSVVIQVLYWYISLGIELTSVLHKSTVFNCSNILGPNRKYDLYIFSKIGVAFPYLWLRIVSMTLHLQGLSTLASEYRVANFSGLEQNIENLESEQQFTTHYLNLKLDSIIRLNCLPAEACKCQLISVDVFYKRIIIKPWWPRIGGELRKPETFHVIKSYLLPSYI